MIEALHLLLICVMVASLCAIAVYVVGFVAVAVLTLRRRARPDPLAEELDRVLAEIVGVRAGVRPAVGRSPGRYR